MKIVIDIDQHFKEGRINSEEHSRLKGQAVKETSSLAFNILVGFRVIATTAGMHGELIGLSDPYRLRWGCSRLDCQSVRLTSGVSRRRLSITN